jgi:hypothetical protein
MCAVAAFAFGIVARGAVAGHYHTAGPCGAGNGMVQGSSTTDGAYHARVEMPSSCPPTEKLCAVYNYPQVGAFAYGDVYYGTCNQFLQYTPECEGYAGVFYDAEFSMHNHFAHNSCI